MGGRAQVVGAVVALAGLAGVVGACSASSGARDSAGTTSTVAPEDHTTVASVNGAVPLVERLLTITLSSNDVRVLVVDLCAAAATGNPGTITHDLEGLALTSTDALTSTITALGRGAEAYCPDAVAIAPRLLHDLFAAVAPSVHPR